MPIPGDSPLHDALGILQDEAGIEQGIPEDIEEEPWRRVADFREAAWYEEIEGRTGRTAHGFTEALQRLLQSAGAEAELEQGEIRQVATFEEAGVQTMDAGLVVRFADGAEYRLTVVRAR